VRVGGIRPPTAAASGVCRSTAVISAGRSPTSATTLSPAPSEDVDDAGAVDDLDLGYEYSESGRNVGKF
jgi:hypothetical protein